MTKSNSSRPADSNRIFANNLLALMKQNGKSRQDVCTDLDIKYTTFTGWVTGQSFPRVKNLEKLAKYFNVTTSQLIGDISQNPTTKSTKSPMEIANSPLQVTDEHVWKFISNFEEIVKQCDDLTATMRLIAISHKLGDMDEILHHMDETALSELIMKHRDSLSDFEIREFDAACMRLANKISELVFNTTLFPTD